jgi:hypothetical protein
MSGELRSLQGRRRSVVVAFAIVALVACNERHPLDTLPPSPLPTAVPAPPPLAASPYTLFAVTASPLGMLGGSSARGTVVMTAAAPPGGTVVTLSTSDSAVSVPPAVTVPPGRDSVDFDVVTSPVDSDRQVTLVASIPERRTDVSLALWSVQPTFFSFANDPPSSVIPAHRAVPPAATFTGFCSGNRLDVSIREGSSNSSFVRIRAGLNRRLAVGTYDIDRATITTTSPDLIISGSTASCGGSEGGHFVVRESDLAPDGTIRRFWVSFELRCPGVTTRVTRGDLRLTDVGTGTPPFTGSCAVP